MATESKQYDFKQLLREARLCMAGFRGSHNQISLALSKKLCGCNQCMEFMRIENLLMNAGVTNCAEVTEPEETR
jgi:hypothetical protein